MPVGLHEMAHALELENMIENEEYQFFPTQVQQRWKQLAPYYIESIKRGETDFFREYAATNVREFFAVAVEYFFENSAEFQRQHLELYEVLVSLLNQNPLRLAA